MKTVFYAWQSDLPNATNRSFIEDCLERAVSAANQNRQPDDLLVIDKDTQGEAGMPDISRVIFDKIDNCAVFVPDLSITTRSDGKRSTPNPNVLIELGYALRAIGDRRIVGVFNEEFGSADDLPFDLRNRRWPISYRVQENCAPELRQAVRDKLVRTLTHALSAAAARAEPEKYNDSQSEKFFSSASPAGALGRFPPGSVVAHVDASTPGVKATGEVIWRDAPHAYIDLRPIPGIPADTYSELRKLAIRPGFNLLAFGKRRTQWISRNGFGVIAGDILSTPFQAPALCVTQLYKNNGALYGINQGICSDVEGRSILDGVALVEEFTNTLENYFEFYQKYSLKWKSLHLYIGLQGIQGMFLRAGRGNEFAGPITDSALFHSVDPLPANPSAYELLIPLFSKVWDSAGLEFASPA